MISNYIKLALRGMGRNKFFSAISLFGISFTLAILMLIVSTLETEIGSTKPLSEKDRMVILPVLTMQKVFYDTIYTFDTIIQDGIELIDTAYTLDQAGRNNSNNEYAWWFLDRHFSNLPSVSDYTFYNDNNTFNAYVQNSKVEMQCVYADAGFWDVFDFEFLEGSYFGPEAIDQESKVAVISTELADQYFGRTDNVLDEEIEMDGMTLKVVGLVKPVGKSLMTADIIVPRTLNMSSGRREEIGFGGYKGVLLAAPNRSIAQVKADVDLVESGLEAHPLVIENMDEVITIATSYNEVYAHSILDLEEPEDSLKVMRWILIGLLSFFILLPILNLVNLNVSRILERSSEIGVRKAFGATRGNILGQFIVENIIQTFIGALIGLVLALVFINWINDARLMGDVLLKVNYKFFIYCFLIALLFGVLSGILPAFKMSKVHVVNALKQYKL